MILGKNTVGEIQLGHIGFANPGQPASPRLEFIKRCPGPAHHRAVCFEQDGNGGTVHFHQICRGR